MGNRRPAAQSPEVRVALDLISPLGRAADPTAQISRALVASIEAGIAGLLDRLGIPGRPVITVATLGEGEALPHDRFFRISVNARPCRYADELLQAVHSATRVAPIAVDATPSALGAWLQPLVDEDAPSAVEFLAQSVVEVVAAQPRVLLGRLSAQAYLDGLARDAPGPVPGSVDDWLPLFRDLLDQRISLGDRRTLARVLREGAGAGMAPGAITEDAIAALACDRVEVQMPAADLRQLTTSWERDGAVAFEYLRTYLFDELGVTFPELVFVARDDVKPGCVRFTINHLPTVPLVGLRPNECAVHEGGRALPAGVPAHRSLNPVTRTAQSIVDLAARPLLSAAGFTTWNQLEYIVLSLGATLRAHAGWAVTRRTFELTLERLSAAFPTLVDAAKASVPIWAMTRLARQLVEEQVSIKDHRGLLEAYIDLPSPQADRLADLRHALRWRVASTHARGSAMVPVYLLDEQLEAMVRVCASADLEDSAGRLAEATTADALVAAVRAELSELRKLASTAPAPSVMTMPELRRCVWRLLAPELPAVRVIAHGEIPPVIYVQPVARVSGAL